MAAPTMAEKEIATADRHSSRQKAVSRFQGLLTRVWPKRKENHAVQRMTERVSRFLDPVSFRRSTAFKPRSDDVFLATGSKAGTTWTGHILHGLRSGGDLSFDDIDVAVPFLDYFYTYMEGDLDSDQAHWSPRIFKTHLKYDDIPRGAAKHIVVVRDPLDSLVSLFYFYRNWVFEDGEIKHETFADWAIGSASEGKEPMHMTLSFICSYYAHRHDDNILWLHFEDLKQDLPQCIRLISDFLGIGVGDEKLLGLVEEQSRFEFMKGIGNKFDAHTIKYACNAAMGLPRDHGFENNPGRVRSGKVNEGRQKLSKATQLKVELLWKTLVEPTTGCATYSEMRASINEELGRNFASV